MVVKTRPEQEWLEVTWMKKQFCLYIAWMSFLCLIETFLRLNHYQTCNAYQDTREKEDNGWNLLSLSVNINEHLLCPTPHFKIPIFVFVVFHCLNKLHAHFLTGTFTLFISSWLWHIWHVICQYWMQVLSPLFLNLNSAQHTEDANSNTSCHSSVLCSKCLQYFDRVSI